MGFFKDLKSDFSKAVDELLLDESGNILNDEEDEDNEDHMVNTLDGEGEESSVDSEKMKEILEDFTQEEGEIAEEQEDIIEDQEEDDAVEDNVDMELFEALEGENNIDQEEEVEEIEEVEEKPLDSSGVYDENDVTVITKGTTIEGNVSSEGLLEIKGIVTGDIECLGKLSITGKVQGESTAAEVYVNTERLEGNINSEGSIKVGLGSVIIGDIVATSGVIAGAVKGEIDINGPVVVDSTAIIVGNIKAQSVQINNGAVIEGHCSLAYSDVDVENVFE